MKTFLKVLLVFLAAAVLIHFWPVLGAPLVIGGVVALTVGGLLAGGVALVATVALLAALAIAGIILGVLAASSPLWIPILAIVGLIALIRKSSRRTA